MQYAVVTDEGFEFYDTQVEGSLPVVDVKPEAAAGFVAALSRYEQVGEEVHAFYTIEESPKTSKSQIDRLADAVAERLLK